jgi:hypothetical protein
MNDLITIAGNVQVVEDDDKQYCRVHIQWHCANCNRIHWLVEKRVQYKEGNAVLDKIGPMLASCGSRVTVFMPWSTSKDAPQRDKESIYGQSIDEQRSELYLPEKFGMPHFQLFLQVKGEERRVIFMPATSIRRRANCTRREKQ